MRWLQRRVGLVLGLVAALLLAVAVGSVMVTAFAVRAESSKTAVAAVALPQAITTQQLCDAGGDVATALRRAGLCEQAARVQREAEAAGAQADTAPAPDRDELVGFVRREVAAYCAGRDDCRPDASVLVETVSRYLRENPPEPGKPPTPEDLATAARAVLVAEPDLFRGAQGDRGPAGDRGPGPTDDQVLAAVAAVCGDGARCQGPPGPQGPGVLDFRFERNDGGQCEAVVVFVDPASGEERTTRRAAGDAACEPVAPPEEPGGILPGG